MPTNETRAPERCPRCGANPPTGSGTQGGVRAVSFPCGSAWREDGDNYQSAGCIRAERDALLARLAELDELLEGLSELARDVEEQHAEALARRILSLVTEAKMGHAEALAFETKQPGGIPKRIAAKVQTIHAAIEELGTLRAAAAEATAR